jgi:hypothetical protein
LVLILPEQGEVKMVDQSAPGVPSIFCDGVVNVAPSAQEVKFYLYRTDRDTAGGPALQQQVSKSQVIAQIIMPLDAYIQTTLFFNRALQALVDSGLVPQERINNISALL